MEAPTRDELREAAANQTTSLLHLNQRLMNNKICVRYFYHCLLTTIHLLSHDLLYHISNSVSVIKCSNIESKNHSFMRKPLCYSLLLLQF